MALPAFAANIVPSDFTTDALKSALASASEGDTIDLSGFSGTLTVEEVLFPAVSMTIRGPADQSVVLTSSLVSGTSVGHCIFNTKTEGIALTLENLAFRNTGTGGWGSKVTDNDDRHPGVVRATGPLVLRSCVFADNWLIKDEADNNNHYGSANVYAGGGLSATDCIFSGTYDNRDREFDYYGETIFTKGGSVGFTNCVFTGNGWTGQTGGNVGVFLATDVSVTGCKFLDNYSQGGSAMLICAATGPVWVKDCIFRNCQSCYHKNNMNFPAIGTMGSSTIYGNCGALWLAKGSFNAVVENCEFTDCSSFSNVGGTGSTRCPRGGAIGWRVDSTGWLTCVNCTFYHCFSGDLGGGIESDMNNGGIRLVNCTFAACGTGTNNRGSALDTNKGRCDILNTVMAYNYKLNDTTLQDWYVNVGRTGYNSWVKCLHWTKFDNNNYRDIHYYADGDVASPQVNATYGTAKTTTTYEEGDPFPEWTASTDYVSLHSTVGNFATDRTAVNAGAGPVPVLNADRKRPRVVEIAPGGPLDGKGYFVKHSDDWAHIAYSADGTTWKAFRGTLANATIPLETDQRGVAYRMDKMLGLRRPPIGSAAPDSAAETLILLF